MSPGREVYRAVYLSSPLKFCTTLHAFSRVLPRYHIDAWRKDPRACERHKWRTSQERKRGRWFYRHGPLSGVRVEGWPDPGLLGAGELRHIVARAQAEALQDAPFWLAIAERTQQLRDVMLVADLATVLDALVSANCRHTDLMKKLTREFIDDVDKMSFMEVAVVANAYAKFNCFSSQLLTALVQQAKQLLGSGNHALQPSAGGEHMIDPQSLAVLAKALAELEYRNCTVLRVINSNAVELVDTLSFATMSDLLVAFVKLRQEFVANDRFWDAVATTVPGSRMTSLCPAFYALSQLHIPHLQLRRTLVSEILQGLEDTPAPSIPVPFGAAIGLWEGHRGKVSATPSLPPFTSDPLASRLLAPWLPEGVAGQRAEVDQVGTSYEHPTEAGDVIVEWAEETSLEEPATEGHAAGDRRPKRFYNSVSRRPMQIPNPTYLHFDTSEIFLRNRRGAMVAEALEGLRTVWRDIDGRRTLPTHRPADKMRSQPECKTSVSASIATDEAALVDASMPVLRSALQGVSASRLAACAEVYAFHFKHGGGLEAFHALHDVVHEAVRKLSNLSEEDILRLHSACLLAGLKDPYLQKAKKKRFPRGLRTKLSRATARAVRPAAAAASQNGVADTAVKDSI